MRHVAVAQVLRLRAARDESGVHGVLKIVIVGECGIDLRRRQIRRRLDDLRRTVTMCHVIGDDIDHPMASAIDARDPVAVQSIGILGRM